MRLKDKEAWDRIVKENDDPYGSATVKYAEEWADLMEERMAEGKGLEEIAKQASHDADTEGITGFMYGCAISILFKVWLCGECLRKGII